MLRSRAGRFRLDTGGISLNLTIPLVGLPSAEIPPELVREWQIEFGKERYRRLLPIAQRELKEQMTEREFERARKRIQEQNSIAAKRATNVINRRYGAGRQKLPRRPTRRERIQPSVYSESLE